MQIVVTLGVRRKPNQTQKRQLQDPFRDVKCLCPDFKNTRKQTYHRRVARIFFVCVCGGGGGGAYLKNRDQIMNILNDTLC